MTSPISGCLERGSPPLPWIYGAAARLEGEDREAMLTDAGVLSRSLATAADLFDLPAVCTAFDTLVEAEAAGCHVDLDGGRPRVVDGCIGSLEDALDVDVESVTDGGRIPAVLDATERLVATLDRTSVLGGVTGPRRLTESMLVEGAVDAAEGKELRYEATLTASDVVIALANAYLARGVDGIAVIEPAGVHDADGYPDAVTPLCNVVDHYDATGVVVQRAVDADDVALAAELGFDAITGRVADRARGLEAADAGVAVGVGVPEERFREGPEAVDAFASGLPAGTLTSSEWEVPEETDPETIHRLMGSL